MQVSQCALHQIRPQADSAGYTVLGLIGQRAFTRPAPPVRSAAAVPLGDRKLPTARVVRFAELEPTRAPPAQQLSGRQQLPELPPASWDQVSGLQR
jgi:hypothetical protein